MKRKLKQWAAKAAHILLYAAAIAVPVKAQQAPPSADTFALSASPKTNYGPSPLLAVTNGATAFMQFNLSGVPANATVSKATLRLYVDAVTAAGSFDVYELDTPWTERTLNFSNAPTPGLSATGSKPVSIGPSNTNQFVLVDVTTLVQEWLNGTVANNGLALELASASGGFSFDSKESLLTSHEPELEITLATAGTQGPPGPAGVTGQAGPAGPRGPQGIPGNLNPGSPLYVQNGTATQTAASFNIDGNGTVGGTLSGSTVNSTNGYQVGGTTMFSGNATSGNIAIGDGAGNASLTGTYNQIIGHNAGSSLTTGAYNVLIGGGTGLATTTGSNNVAIGVLSARYQTSGGFNTFVGPYTGFSTTTGSNNTFLGNSAGTYNSTGSSNTFVGDSVGFYNTTGSGNLYLGVGTGGANTTGSNNVYLSNAGAVESNAIRIGNNQTAAYIAGIFGTSVPSGQPVVIDSTGHLGSAPALSISGTVASNSVNSTTGYQIGGVTELNADQHFDVMIGPSAGNASITGGSSEFIGDFAGSSLTSGNADVFLGSYAGKNTTTGNGDVYIGFHTGTAATTGAYNTFVGGQSGINGTTGAGNTFLGFSSGANIVTGSNDIDINNAGANDESNTIRIGDPANQSAAFIAGIYGGAVTGGQPVYVDSPGHLGTSGNASGYQIGGKTIFNANPAVENIAIGDGAGSASATGGFNQIMGDQAGSSLTSGNADVFIGSSAGTSATTGNGDVYVGYKSGVNSTTGAYNTFLGGESGWFTSTGNSNTYLGFHTGAYNTTGQSNIFLGAQTGNANITGSSNIYLGSTGADESNTIRIGDAASQQSAYMAGIYGVTSGSGVPVYINSNGQLGTQTSSRRYKEDILDMGDATEALMKLRPVSFYYKHEYDNGPRTLQYGLIAEEVAKIFPELVAYNADGSPYTVRYQFLSSMLLNEVQKQYRRSQQQADVIGTQQQEINELRERLSRIEKMLSSGVVSGADRAANFQRD